MEFYFYWTLLSAFVHCCTPFSSHNICFDMKSMAALSAYVRWVWTMKMEAAGFPETFVRIYHTTRRLIPEYSNLHYQVPRRWLWRVVDGLSTFRGFALSLDPYPGINLDFFFTCYLLRLLLDIFLFGCPGYSAKLKKEAIISSEMLVRICLTTQLCLAVYRVPRSRG
jgi:hypothetical protein